MSALTLQLIEHAEKLDEELPYTAQMLRMASSELEALDQEVLDFKRCSIPAIRAVLEINKALNRQKNRRLEAQTTTGCGQSDDTPQSENYAEN